MLKLAQPLIAVIAVVVVALALVAAAPQPQQAGAAFFQYLPTSSDFHRTTCAAGTLDVSHDGTGAVYSCQPGAGAGSLLSQPGDTLQQMGEGITVGVGCRSGTAILEAYLTPGQIALRCVAPPPIKK